MQRAVAQGFEFIEISAQHQYDSLPNLADLPDVPLVWAVPVDIPLEHPADLVRTAALDVCFTHTGYAATLQAKLMMIQFRRPPHVPDKKVLIQHYIDLLTPLTESTRKNGVQLVLRHSSDHRDQLQLLREIVRQIDGLAIALDIAHLHCGTVKPLVNEYLWDSDLSSRLAHIYASDTNGIDPNLQMPLGSGVIDWKAIIGQVKARYNASVCINVSGSDDYRQLSREKWLAWWG